MEKLVSIIIPVYNAERFLDESLNTIFNIKYKNVEIICINDGSNDKSLDILRIWQMKDPRIKIINNTNHGAAYSRNCGIDIALGEYIIFLDADDYYEDNLLDIVFLMEQYQCDIGLVDSDVFINDSGKFILSGTIDYTKIPVRIPFSPCDVSENDVFNFCGNQPWNKVFNTNFVRTNGLRFQNLQHANDLYFVLAAIIVANRIICSDSICVHYRTDNEDSISSKRSKSPLCSCDALYELKNCIEDHNLMDIYKNSYMKKTLGTLIWDSKKYDKMKKIRIFNYAKEKLLVSIDSDFFWRKLSIREKLLYSMMIMIK